MKIFFTFLLIGVLGGTTINAQSFGIGTDAPDANAILELNSSSRGFLMTRLTTAQRDASLGALTAAQAGLLIYNSTDNNYNYWNGTQWISFPGGADHDWYEALTTTAPDNIGDNIFTNGNVGIGLNNPLASLHIANTGAGVQSIRVADMMSTGNAYNPTLATVARNNRATVIVDKTNGLMYSVDADDIFWRLDGNAGVANAGYSGSCPNLITTSMNASAYDFIGTRDNTDFIFATNDRERMRILRDGQMVFYGKGIAVPVSSPTGCVPAYATIDVASFYATGDIYPLNAYSENAPAIYGASTGVGGLAYAIGVEGDIDGEGDAITGLVYANATTFSTGVYASETSLAGYALYSAGDMFISGTIYGPSDEKLKENVKPYSNGLETIMKLAPKSYNYKSQYQRFGLPSHNEVGFIAQDLNTVMPSLVKKSYIKEPLTAKGNSASRKQNVVDILGVDYQGLIPVLTSAIQEQQHQIEDIKMALSNLQPHQGNVSIQQFGTIVLNVSGKAIVTLPAAFVQQSQSFSYQLTSIGVAQQAYISREISNNKFEITGKPNSKVSWVVYGS
jgi:hypothetical protein